MNPGWKSSSFILTIIAQITGILLASGQITNEIAVQVLGVVAMILSGLGYTVARATVTRMHLKVGSQARRIIPPGFTAADGVTLAPQTDSSPYDGEGEDVTLPSDDTPAINMNHFPTVWAEGVSGGLTSGETKSFEVHNPSHELTGLILLMGEMSSKHLSVENVKIGGKLVWNKGGVPITAFRDPIKIFDEEIHPSQSIEIILTNLSPVFQSVQLALLSSVRNERYSDAHDRAPTSPILSGSTGSST